MRSTLASNPAIGEALICTLSTDQGHDVRFWLAHHPRLPLDILAQLTDATPLGSPLLPRIASAPAHEIEQLAASPNPTLRMLVAQRRDLPPRIRDVLAADGDAKVIKSIAPHPGLSETRLRAMVARHGVRVLAKVATNPDAAPALLEDLARHQPPARKALREIARHPGATSAALLICLADRRARPIAARHRALPPDAAAEPIDDQDWQVVAAAAANPSLPHAVMSRLVP